MIRLFVYIALIGTVLFFVGCAGGSNTYTQQGKKNLSVYTNVESGVDATLEIYRVEGKCQRYLEGEVGLKEGKAQFSLLEKQLYFLRVRFDSYSLLSGSGTTSLGSYVHIKSNNLYTIKVTYRDDMYDVVFIKKDKRTNTIKEMDIIPLERCRENSSKPFIEIEWFPALNSSVEI